MDNAKESLENDSTYEFLRSLSLPAVPFDSEDHPKKRAKTDSGNWYPIGRITPSPDYFDLQKGEKLLTSQRKGNATNSLNVTSPQDSKKTDTQFLEQSYVASTTRYIVDPKGSVRGLPSDSPEALDFSTGIVNSNSDESVQIESKPGCKIYKEWKLSPPCDGNVPLPKVERPLGCKTVSVDGLPLKMSESVVREIFRECGQIFKIKCEDSFVVITFQRELAVDKALNLNGYKVSNGRSRSVIRVDFVPVWKEQQEYIRKMEVRKVDEETKQLGTKTSKKGSSSPMPLNTEFSNKAMRKLLTKLRRNTTANHITDLLVRWMEEGKCNQGNCQHFYGALMIIQASLPKILAEREKLRETVQQTQDILKEKYSSNSLYFAEILKAFDVATSETVLDNFSPEMKPTIEKWKEYIEAMIESNSQDMMNVHSSSWDKIFVDEKVKTYLPQGSTSEYSVAEQQMSEIRNLQVENDRLNKELKVAQQETLEKITGLISQRSDKPTGGNQKITNINKDNPGHKSIKITERDARLIALIGPFLNFHRSGESTENICRHLTKIDSTVTSENLEGLMRKLPKVFKEELIECADNSETKWTLLGI